MKGFAADYHVHSSFSFDARFSPARMVEGALEKGIGEICFTEHKDLDPFYNETGYYKDGPYSAEIAALQEKYRGRIVIKKGVEVDYQSSTEKEFQEFLGRHSFDFVLASVHALEHCFVDEGYFQGRSPGKVYEDYLREVLALSRLQSFDVLGHLDYFTRFSPEDHPFDPARHQGILREILKNLAKNGRGLELNTSGWRHGIGKPFPSPAILKMFREEGGEVVTIGSDSHHPRDLASRFTQGIELLQDAGFTGIYLFTGRKASKVPF
jgi:histidinol-phosphatase (PHP family)